MLNVLTEITEGKNDPQLKIKIKYLNEENKALLDENIRLFEQLQFLKTQIVSKENKKEDKTHDNPETKSTITILLQELQESREKVKQLQYENFVSSQIIDSIKIIENDLKSFFEGRIGDLKIRIEGFIEKVKELESLKSIPLGQMEKMNYFIITKNVI